MADRLIDVHSHLLPGIDDGCRSLDESLACVRSLMAHGFVGTVCTPHMAVDSFPDNTPANIEGKVARLREQLRAAELDYQLWAGGELRLDEDTLAWLHRHGAPTLGLGPYVLVDYWGQQWPSFADEVIDYLCAEGYRPILAHPERMNFPDRHWDAVLTRLQEAGVWLQGNLKCLAGHEGSRLAERSRRLLSAQRYHLLATDMHGTMDLAERLAGLATVEEHAGAEAVAQLLGHGPSMVISPRQA